MNRKVKNFIKIIVLLASDSFSAWFGFYLAFLIRRSVLPAQVVHLYYEAMPLIIFTLVLTLALRNSYTKEYVYFLDEILDLFIGFITVSVIFMSFTFLYKIGPAYSRIATGIGFLLGFAISIILRFIIKFTLAKLGVNRKNVLIIGAGRTGVFALKSLRRIFLSPYKIVGILDDNKDGSKVDNIRVIGKISKLKDLINKLEIDEVVFAITNFPIDRLSFIENICDEFNIPMKVVPNLFGLSIANSRSEEIEGILFLELARNKITGINAIMKRIMDIIIAFISLLLLSPLFILIPVLIKIDSKGSVFFKHKRIGQYGKIFYCIKFRTMVENAEEVLKELLDKDPSVREEFYKNFKLKNDPRVTRIGKFLRKTSLDEIPQIINVLKGEMSIIGPRPVVEKELEKYGKYGELLLQVKPGMAGMWVANGRNDVSYQERIAMDVYYIKNWSLWLDVKIFVNAAISVLRKKGAY